LYNEGILFQVDILTNLLNTSLITTTPYPTLPLAADDEFNYLDLQIASYQKKIPSLYN
jgi:hypothetical protein